MKLEKYAEMFKNGSIGKVEGLCGRIIRGTKPDDFKTLTDDPDRKLVMLMGPDGLEKLLGKTGYDMLVEIGYETDYIQRKVDEGNEFKLVTFEEGGEAKLATWDNVIEVISAVYPQIASKLYKNLEGLKQVPFDAIEKYAGYDFSEVDKNGKTDSRYMTIERYEQAGDGLVEARAFLYFTVHLRELFSGDGYTYTADGRRGLMEYIVANKPIQNLGENKVIDIDVKTIKTISGGTTMTKSKYELEIPSFYDESKTGEVFRVPYEERARDAKLWAKQKQLQPAATDKFRICLMPIDVQNTFCLPDFELFVGGRTGTGAIDDNVRFAKFIYRYLGIITEIDPTMDTHTAMQIFHQEFWINDQGENPAPMTMIEFEEVKMGIWKVNPGIANSVAGGNYLALQKYAMHYVGKLTAEGKYPLIIWPYHAMLGGIGHALVANIEEALFFHNIARKSQTGFEIKGGNPLTENYSVLRPEVLEDSEGRPIAQKNARFIKKLLNYDAVVIGGQAKSHCVAWTIADLLDEILAQDPKLAKKVYLLEDCTSPVVVPGVVDFTDQGNEAFQKFADAGMNIVKSTDPIETWPGIRL